MSMPQTAPGVGFPGLDPIGEEMAKIIWNACELDDKVPTDGEEGRASMGQDDEAIWNCIKDKDCITIKEVAGEKVEVLGWVEAKEGLRAAGGS